MGEHAERVAGLTAEVRPHGVAFLERGELLAVADVRSAESELCAPLSNLIAAAPDLLAELIESQRLLWGMRMKFFAHLTTNESGKTMDSCARSERAIAKAARS